MVRPFNRNKRVQWNPTYAHAPLKETANNGGGIFPPIEEQQALLDSSEDKFDAMEELPEPKHIEPSLTPFRNVPIISEPKRSLCAASWNRNRTLRLWRV